MKSINNSMNEYILNKTKVLQDSGNFKDRTSQQIATMVYQGLYSGDENYINEFFKTLETNIDKPVNKITETDAPKTTVSNYKLSPKKDSFIIKDTKQEVTFDSILKNNEEDKLPSELLPSYNEWKSKQNVKPQRKETTYQDMQKKVSENNQKIIGAFSNFTDNMGNIKSNNQYGNQNPIKSNS